MGLTRIERHSKDLRELAETLKVSIYSRDKVYWGSIPGFEFQLTYPVDARGKKPIKVETLDQKCEMALSVLRKVETARAERRTHWARGMKIFAGLQDETIPTFKPKNFCYYVDDSLDHGVASRFMKCSVSIRLVGGKEIEAEGSTWKEAMDALYQEGQKHDWGMLYCRRCNEWIPSTKEAYTLNPGDDDWYCTKCIDETFGKHLRALREKSDEVSTGNHEEAGAGDSGGV